MLGTAAGKVWPHVGEIDIIEAVNGGPHLYHSLHSSNHHGGNPQHPEGSPTRMNTNLNENPLIAGLEWNVKDSKGQIDITWWKEERV